MMKHDSFCLEKKPEFLLVTEIDSPLILQKTFDFYVTPTAKIILTDVLRPYTEGVQKHSNSELLKMSALVAVS